MLCGISWSGPVTYGPGLSGEPMLKQKWWQSVIAHAVSSRCVHGCICVGVFHALNVKELELSAPYNQRQSLSMHWPERQKVEVTPLSEVLLAWVCRLIWLLGFQLIWDSSKLLCFVCSTEGDGKREAVEGGGEDSGKCCGEDWWVTFVFTEYVKKSSINRL